MKKIRAIKKELHFIRQEIYRTEVALKMLHEKFEEQTNSVIQSFATEKNDFKFRIRYIVIFR